MAPARTLARRPQAFPLTVRRQLTDLETALGGRASLVGMLTLAPLTPDLHYILGLLGDPDKQALSLAEACAAANVLPGELLKHLAAAALLKGKVQAQQVVGEGIRAVAVDVMRRAAPYEETCYACGGTGSITPDPTPQVPNPGPGPCDTCKASGRLRYTPELDRQKLAIEMAQLLPKSGGLQIAVQQVNAAGGGMNTLEKLQALTDRALYGEDLLQQEDETVEGETVEGEAVDDTVEGALVDPAPDA